MQFGICVPLEKVAEVLPAEPDFIEEHIQNFFKPAEPDAAFAENRARAAAAPVPIPAANCFWPAKLKVVGPDVNMDALLAYAEVAFARAEAAGTEIFVFGSAGARMLPEGFARDRAFKQIVELLRKIAPLAARHRVTLVMEPLHKAECNFINTLAEGAEAAQCAAQPNVWLLADLFHMLRDGETPDQIVKFGYFLRHVHLAEKEKRTAPGLKGDNFRPYFRALKAAGYDRRMAVECGWTNRTAEAILALKTVRQQWAEA